MPVLAAVVGGCVEMVLVVGGSGCCRSCGGIGNSGISSSGVCDDCICSNLCRSVCCEGIGGGGHIICSDVDDSIGCDGDDVVTKCMMAVMIADLIVDVVVVEMVNNNYNNGTYTYFCSLTC